LLDCCRYGPCHPSLLHALLCPQILMAQVLTRLKMNWCGDRAPEYEWKRTFRKVVVIVGLYWGMTILLSPYHGKEEAPFLQTMLYRMVGWAFTIYTLFVLTKLRQQVRLMFDIPVRIWCFGPWEDLCLSFWCGLCVVSQVARQTCEYEEQRAACWSSTGLMSSSRESTTVMTV
jgi:hypothetical protein